MRKAFCYICGENEWKEGLCKEHYSEKLFKIKIPSKVEIIKCSKCDMIKLRHKWQEIFEEDYLEAILKKREYDLKIKRVGVDKKDIIFRIIVSKKGLEKEKELIVHLNRLVCGVCGRRLGGYYEGIIQVRGNFSEKMLKIIAGEIKKHGKKDRFGFYRTVKVKGGVDFYIGSKSIVNKVAKFLSNNYKISQKKSYKHVTHKDSREVYRNIILLRFE